jgi:hypothetical protein
MKNIVILSIVTVLCSFNQINAQLQQSGCLSCCPSSLSMNSSLEIANSPSVVPMLDPSANYCYTTLRSLACGECGRSFIDSHPKCPGRTLFFSGITCMASGIPIGATLFAAIPGITGAIAGLSTALGCIIGGGGASVLGVQCIPIGLDEDRFEEDNL